MRTAYGSRTRHSSVKGMRLSRLTNAALFSVAFPVLVCKRTAKITAAGFLPKFFRVAVYRHSCFFKLLLYKRFMRLPQLFST